MSENISVNATSNNVAKVIDFICDQLKDMNCSKKIINHVKLASEEILVNISSYAYPDKNTGSIESNNMTANVTITDNPSEITITFSDSGIPFNPLAKEDPDITLPASERTPGGLGILLTKKLMDDIRYEYKDNQNILTIAKKLS